MFFKLKWFIKSQIEFNRLYFNNLQNSFLGKPIVVWPIYAIWKFVTFYISTTIKMVYGIIETIILGCFYIILLLIYIMISILGLIVKLFIPSDSYGPIGIIGFTSLACFILAWFKIPQHFISINFYTGSEIMTMIPKHIVSIVCNFCNNNTTINDFVFMIPFTKGIFISGIVAQIIGFIKIMFIIELMAFTYLIFYAPAQSWIFSIIIFISIIIYIKAYISQKTCPIWLSICTFLFSVGEISTILVIITKMMVTCIAKIIPFINRRYDIIVRNRDDGKVRVCVDNSTYKIAKSNAYKMIR